MAETKEVPAWTYTHPDAHPDNKPPVTAVAKPSEEAVKQYEESMNTAIEKSQPEPLSKAAPATATAAAVDYDEMTVAELKELAAKKGIEVHWDSNKADIIKALKKADKA